MESKEIKYFVGKKNLKYQIKNSKLELAFKNYRKFNICNFGRFYCWSITANDCYNKISNLIKKKNDYLIK